MWEPVPELYFKIYNSNMFNTVHKFGVSKILLSFFSKDTLHWSKIKYFYICYKRFLLQINAVILYQYFHKNIKQHNCFLYY